MTVTVLMIDAARAAADMATRAFVAAHAGEAFRWLMPGRDELGQPWGDQWFTLGDVHPTTGAVGLVWADGRLSRWTLAEFTFEYSSGRIRRAA